MPAIVTQIMILVECGNQQMQRLKADMGQKINSMN